MRQVLKSSSMGGHRSGLSRRSALVFGLLLLPGVASAGDSTSVSASANPRACAPYRVLFVCPAGTVKSAIAREVLRRKAPAWQVPIEVRSRGLKIEDHLYPELAERLHADGIEPTSEPARTFALADAAWADIVIAFDEAAAAPGLSEARAWRTPSWVTDYDRAKADLDQRLGELLNELAESSCRSTSSIPR
ncbi:MULTISPECIES: low molecular weight phosphatase family protein [Caulobacter]|jgi:protein-tyrosine-phosphatase|uniref:Phosphotyrosine protein phosphatase I domain-containing protein n=1 Tax=Caulobacter vibrioides OR37 TaxID=1292034 RepID=R0D2M6_CAUVI|nr:MULTISPECIES: hypothetical protein [Caulobacter]ENZ82891.1 hypothetical protein OR37_01085 [Caulobacter vibrioides OR37]PIB96881.1 hypothetical protein CSW60_20570 [Caulobacter sp. X]